MGMSIPPTPEIIAAQDVALKALNSRPRAYTIETMTTSDEEDFICGDVVEARLRVNPKLWKRGVLTSVDPLKVCPDNHKRSFKAMEIRKAPKIKKPESNRSYSLNSSSGG